MPGKNHSDTVYILGLGALGGIYAAKLYDQFHGAVKIIADIDRIGTLRRSGVTINGKAYFFDYVEPGNRPKQPVDLIIIAVKSHQLQRSIRDIQAFITKDTIVISLLNGISSEELIGAQIGIEHLLYAYGVGMDAVREGSVITYKNPGRIVFGERNNEVLSDRVKALKDLVLKAPYGVFRQNEKARDLMLMAMGEVVSLSRKIGINLDQSDVDEIIQIINGLNPSGKPSMLQDVEARWKTEVDLFAGNIVDLGKKYGVPTPQRGQ
jgi:2-dehydropantoate 2-reductase